MRRAVPIALALAVVAVIAVEALTASSNGPQGKPAPPLPNEVLRPPRVSLTGLRGHAALVNFWASWCDPCRKEAPELERLYRSMPAGDRLVGVDYTDQEDGARSFIRSYGWTFPILADPDGVYGARFGFSGLPTTVVLDPRGRIVETLRGPQTAADFRQALERARSD